MCSLPVNSQGSLTDIPKGLSIRQRVRVTQLCRKVYGPGQNDGEIAWNFLERPGEGRSLNCWEGLTLTKETAYE